MEFSEFREKVNIERKLNNAIDKRFDSRKPKKERKPMNIVLKSLITVAVTLAVVGFLSVVGHYTPVLSLRYENAVNFFYVLQDAIINLPNKWLIALTLLLVYVIKAYVPILPLSLVCVIAGAFCPYWWLSLLVNMLGLAIQFAVKYRSGKQKGDGYMQNLIKHSSKRVKMALEVGGVGGYGMLFAFRLFPIFPINFVSRLYGTNKDVHFNYYMLVSLAGIFPRIFVYTYLGREIFDPFSKKFVGLLIVMALAVGLSVFVTNLIFYTRRNLLNKDSD